MARDGASKTLTNEQILRMLYACGPGLCTSVFASIKYKSLVALFGSDVWDVTSIALTTTTMMRKEKRKL